MSDKPIKVLVSGTDDLSNTVAKVLRRCKYPHYEVVRYEDLPPEGLNADEFHGVWIGSEVLKLLP
jgi:hypothetical protein